MSQYIEYEIRTVASDSRLYNTAKFPTYGKVPKEDRIPNFEGDYKPPIYLKYEEIPPPPEAEEGEGEEEIEANKWGRRRRRWYHSKQYRWVMADRTQKEIYHGMEEGNSSSKYVVLMPPENDIKSFRLVPVHKWYQFKLAPKIKALSMDKAMEALEKQRNFTSGYMKKLQKKKEDEGDGSDSKTASVKKVKFAEPVEDKDDDGDGDDNDADEPWFKVTDGKKKRANPGEDEINNEKDIEALAIDRMAGDGAGGSESFADFNEEFDDDQDDGVELAAEEFRDSERFMQSAESMREAAEDDENELEDAEEEVEAVDEEEFLDQETEKGGDFMDEEEDEVENERKRMLMQKNYFKKPVLESDNRKRKLSPSSSKTSTDGPKPPQKEADTPHKKAKAGPSSVGNTDSKSSSQSKSSGTGRSSMLKQIENKVMEIIKLTGGKIKTKQLSKQIKKEFPVNKNMTKEQRANLMRKAVMNVCVLENDAVEGAYLVLKD